ncbi:MAG: flotillin-like FloA family protein, partial [Phycisphaerales bacterium]|nr:flotillin-like FloA family protein [Phycisphaerales bacterium]
MPSGNVVLLVILAVVLLVIVILAFVVGRFFKLYIQALLSNARVGLLELVGMQLRQVDIRMIVYSRIRAVKAGLNISTAQLETHFLAGSRRVPDVVTALIAAKRARIELDWDTAASIDLAGRDILDAVNTSVNPKVIDCPNVAMGRTTIDAVAKDGIQLKARARVTVRTNLARLVGGATEETIIARVGEGIVSAIG